MIVRSDYLGFFGRAVGAAVGDSLTVNSFHHQAADPEHLGEGLKVTAVSYDGFVEAIERCGDRMVLGVQFHPERMDDLAPLLFGQLVAQAEIFRRSR